MKEIEVKAKIDDLQSMRKKLEAMGCVCGEPTEQEDAIFVNFDGDFTLFRPGTNFLRIRKTKGKTLFTLKQPQKNELDCIEKEVEISDANAFKESLEFMGYHEAVKVYKTRTKTHYEDMEICLDEVKGLGSFVEVEKMAEGDADAVQEELFAFLKMFGIKKEDQVTQGYDTLTYKCHEHAQQP